MTKKTMDEKQLFEKIFIHNPASLPVAQLYTYPKILNPPSFENWLEFKNAFSIKFGYIDVRKNNIPLELGHTHDGKKVWFGDFDVNYQGLEFITLMTCLNYENDPILYRNTFLMIMRILCLCCELSAGNSVKSPPSLSDGGDLKIHPGQKLAMASQILCKQLPVLSIIRRHEYKQKIILNDIITVRDLFDIEEIYQYNRLFGFLETDNFGKIYRHMHMWSLHGYWSQPSHSSGFTISPNFQYTNFFDIVNDMLPANAQQIEIYDPLKNKKLRIKITNDIKICHDIFKNGYTFVSAAS